MNSLSIVPLIYNLFPIKKPKNMDKTQFSFWLSGFIDAEGNFQVFLDRQYLRTQFRIRLHIDDVDVLYKIKKFLGVGIVEKYNNNCLYSIRNIKEMNQILFPLLDQHKLISTKYLDYIECLLTLPALPASPPYGRVACLLRQGAGVVAAKLQGWAGGVARPKLVVNYLTHSSSTRLSEEKLAWAKDIMKNMNSGRTSYNYSLITKDLVEINPYWLLGFIEGEATFGFKNLSPYFQLGDLHIRNRYLLQQISLYLQSLPKTFTFTINSKPPRISNALHTNATISVISIQNVDALYDYLLFFLLNMPPCSFAATTPAASQPQPLPGLPLRGTSRR